MLARLGDPYTRVLPPDEAAAFQVASDGALQGVGLLIASDVTSGRVVVVAPVEGGPADRAGIRAGDEVLAIDGTPTTGWDGRSAAALLRGLSGSSVVVDVARVDDVPGVASRPGGVHGGDGGMGGLLSTAGARAGGAAASAALSPASPRSPHVSVRHVSLRREPVELSPVAYAALPARGGHTLGYVRLATFSQRAASDVQRAVVALEAQGADAFILDLRGNPGGLVRAGMDVTRLWLGGSAPVFNVVGRDDAGGDAAVVQARNGGDGVGGGA